MDNNQYEVLKQKMDKYKMAENRIDMLTIAKNFAISKFSKGNGAGITYGSGSDVRFIPSTYAEDFASVVANFCDECIKKEREIQENI